MSESQPKKPSVRNITVDSGQEGQRIDNFLLGFLKGVPRSYIYRIVRSGEVRINKGRVKVGYRLRIGDRVRIPPVRMSERPQPRPAARLLERLEPRILYEDDRLLVLNKPSGLAVHGGSGIGLTIARHLAWAMGGELTAASPGPNQGSTFTFTLPAAQVATPLAGKKRETNKQRREETA